MTPVVLRTPRLVLDQPGEQDIDAVVAYCQDPVLQRFTTIPVPYGRSDAERFLLELVPAWWAAGTEETFAIRERTGGPLLGVIGAREEHQDVGYWMGAPHRGRGYLGEALAAVLDHRFREGRPVVNWSCVEGNVPSARTARRAGFRYTGTGPATVVGRDGDRPTSWHGVLRAGDPREPQPGWPAEVEVAG